MFNTIQNIGAQTTSRCESLAGFDLAIKLDLRGTKTEEEQNTNTVVYGRRADELN